MADNWRERLLPASFRNVAFLIENDAVPVGRTVQLHQYPKRDEAYAEQMGKVARVHKVTGYVIGPDCFEQRDALLDALEAEGQGTLVHPWLGQLAVTAGVGSMKHNLREGGMVRFELEFYPGTPQLNPGVLANTAQLTTQATASYWQAAVARYHAAMAVVDSARINLAGLQNRLAGVFNAINQQLAPVGSSLGSLSALAHMLVNAPAALASLFEGFFSDLGLPGSASSSSASAAAFDRYGTALATLASLAETAASIDSIGAASGADTTAAAQALANLAQDALLVQAMATLAQLPVGSAPAASEGAPALEQQVVAPITRAEVPVANDVLAVREALDSVLWQAALKADAAFYPLLNTARQQAVRHLTAVAASGVRLVSITPAETLPALVLAYQRFGDATRAAEVVQRNQLAHPGFVPAVPLQLAME